MLIEPIKDREKGFIFNREQDDKFVSVEIRISERELEHVYELADLFHRINRKSEYRSPVKILEWALFTGLFDVMFECFQTMNDNDEITETQWADFVQKWETSDYDTRQTPGLWG